MDRIAIQGYKGSFHELAANKMYGKRPKELVFCKTFLDVFEALENGTVDFALTAIGNNRYGDINHVYDILANNHLGSARKQYYIVGEVYLNISQCLLVTAGTKLSDIKTVYSQAPAIVQCFSFIHSRLSKAVVVEQDDTALSAELVSRLKSHSAAAIASKEAGKIFGLKVLAEDVQDDINNITRFVLISLASPKDYETATKTSMLLSTKHKMGDLAKALDLLVANNVHLSYLQSISIPNRLFEYSFYLDIDGGLEDQRVQNILVGLKKLGYKNIILGSYKKVALPKLKHRS